MTPLVCCISSAARVSKFHCTTVVCQSSRVKVPVYYRSELLKVVSFRIFSVIHQHALVSTWCPMARFQLHAKRTLSRQRG